MCSKKMMVGLIGCFCLSFLLGCSESPEDIASRVKIEQEAIEKLNHEKALKRQREAIKNKRKNALKDIAATKYRIALKRTQGKSQEIIALYEETLDEQVGEFKGRYGEVTLEDKVVIKQYFNKFSAR